MTRSATAFDRLEIAVCLVNARLNSFHRIHVELVKGRCHTFYHSNVTFCVGWRRGRSTESNYLSIFL